MKAVKIIAAIVILIMAVNVLHVAIVGGMDHGVGLDTFLAGSKDPWQAFINTDLVAGLILSVSWIIYRQRGSRTIDTVAWVWLVLWWGNIVVATYVLHAAYQSNGDWGNFFSGSRTKPALRNPASRRSFAVRLSFGVVAAGTAIYLFEALSRGGVPVLAIIGYVAGFLPIVLAATLLVRRRSPD